MKKKFLQLSGLLLMSFVVFGQTSDLFFSEYAEGSSNNKYLEIFNGTGISVDLSDYAILTNYNGKAWSGLLTFASNTMLANNDVYVIANSSADATITGAADITMAYTDSGYIVGFTGDDVRALCKIVNAGTTETDTFTYYGTDMYLQRMDIIGVYDMVDPGNGWAVAGVADATKDHTLIRKSSVDGPQSCWTCAAGTDSLTSEWLVFPKNTWTGVGSHTYGTPPPGIPMYTITEVTTYDSNNYPDSIGVECWLQGTVLGVDLDGNGGYSFTIHDGFAGINVYKSSDVDNYVVREGDKIKVLGKIAFYNGLTEIGVDSIRLLDSNMVLPAIKTVTKLSESTESELIKIENLTLVDTTQWPAPGSNANVEVTNGVDTFTMRIDKDTEIDGSPFPTSPFDLVGIGGQYDYSSPYDEGYQIFPRTLADIVKIIPPPTYTISQIITADPTTGFPDSLGVECWIKGVVHGINYRAYKPGLNFVVHDGTRGIWLYYYSGTLGYNFREGDEIMVLGKVDFYNGLTEFVPSEIVLADSNKTLMTPIVVTSFSETNEADLVTLDKVWAADTSQWPKPSDYAVNVDVTNGIDTFVMRIVTDCNIHGTAPRTDTFFLTGLQGQYDGSFPFDEGYQIFPRDTNDLVHFDASSIREAGVSTDLIYPNPNSGRFVIANNTDLTFEVNVINSLGETIIATRTDNGRALINLKNAEKGLYFVRITHADGQSVIKKVIKR